MKARDIVATAVILMVMFVCCNPEPTDTRLDQMDIVISKWEREVYARPVDFNDLVHIQTDITAYDVDQAAFESAYGTLSIKQQSRLTDLRTRFRKLLKKSN